MKRHPPPTPPRTSVNVTAMCDIMLCLLIFFMLVSKAGIDTGADEKLNLPLARLGITDEQLRKERNAGSLLVLNIDPAGLPQNPRIYGKFFTGEPFSLNVVDPVSRQPLLSEFLRSLKGNRTDFIVTLHADAGTPFFAIEPVLRAVNTAKPSQVRFAFQGS